MQAYICEFIGTMMLIILGDGVVANVTLEKSGMKNGGTVQICMGWGFAVMLPAFIFGAISGAHFNPALTIALAVNGAFKWSMVPGYIVAQMAGGFAGAIIVWLMFKDHYDVTEDARTKLATFCTVPAIKNTPRNIFCELVATFVLVFAILGISQVVDLAPGLSQVFVFGIICSIGMSLGGTTGYALNPARDIGPRFAHAILPIKGKGPSNWDYAIVPVIGPILGGLVAVGLYALVF
ncbi:MAG: aquaporin family protein [Eubacterium sp.]|nr:aquaporin family protein [Candidatus Colimonas fimequi]